MTKCKPNFNIIIVSIILGLSIACGGGGGGDGSSNQPSLSNEEITLLNEAPKFNYSMVDTCHLKITVNGVSKDKRACLVQVRVLDMMDQQEYGQWKGYLHEDGSLYPELALPSANKTLRIIVHQAGKTTQEMVQNFPTSSLYFQPSGNLDIVQADNFDITFNLIDIPQQNKPQLNKVPTETEYVDKNISIPTSVLETVSLLLPEGTKAGAVYLDDRYNPNLPILASATIDVTFIHEGAGYRNTFGYFTYSRDSEGQLTIIDRQLVFPNTSYLGGGGKLHSGDTAKLRDSSGNIRVFEAGENVAFFIIANGYNGSSVTGWDDDNPIYPSLDPSVNMGPSKGTLTTLDEINPENSFNRPDIARHVAMIKIDGIDGFLNNEDFIIIGMEDIKRNRGDNDFNDCVFIVSADPISAIGTEEIVSYNTETPDTDLDGIIDVMDAWPSDPSRAYTERSPTEGYATLVYEDLYPSLGDADYNDLVVHYFYETVLNGFGEVKEFQGTFQFTARGSHLDHAFGIALRGVSPSVGGKVNIERFFVDDTKQQVLNQNLSLYQGTNRDGSTYVRVKDVCESTIYQLPGLISMFANTERPYPEQSTASSRLVIEFNDAIDSSMVTKSLIDPFLYVDNGFAKIDIHLPGFEGFTERPSHLPLEVGPNSFINDDGWPWAMELPVDFKFPLEGVPVGTYNNKEAAYDYFDDWATTSGNQSQDWYIHPKYKNDKEFISREPPVGRFRNWGIGKD